MVKLNHWFWPYAALLCIVALMAWLMVGCSADISSSNRDIVTHCTTHTFGGDGKAAGTTEIEDCDISIDSKSKSKTSGF